MRKNILQTIAVCVTLTFSATSMISCGSGDKTESSKDSTKDSGVYGQTFDKSTAISADSGFAHWQDHTKEVVLKGACSAVCQTEGCWFKYKLASGDLFVDFNHEFKIAKDCAGKTMFAKGYFYQDTTSVEMLQEYAKDDGKSAEEIAKITEPKVEVTFRATGVVIE